MSFGNWCLASDIYADCINKAIDFNENLKNVKFRIESKVKKKVTRYNETMCIQHAHAINGIQ